jgi:hypothetical protein
VRKVDQDLQSFEDNLVRLLALNMDHEADATSVVLVSRVIQTLLDREADHA